MVNRPICDKSTELRNIGEQIHRVMTWSSRGDSTAVEVILGQDFCNQNTRKVKHMEFGKHYRSMNDKPATDANRGNVRLNRIDYIFSWDGKL